MDIPLPIIKIIELVLYLSNVKAVNTTDERLTERLRKHICEFQLQYTEYHFTAAQLHRDFKEAQKSNNPEVAAYLDDLEEYIESEGAAIYGMLAKSIRQYFTCTRKTPTHPRVGIHMAGDDGKLISVAMLPNNAHNIPKSVDKYTPFIQINEDGHPYLNNNIPKNIRKWKKNREKMIKNGADPEKLAEYMHAGIDLDRVLTEYQQPKSDWKVFSRWKINSKKEKPADENWSLMRKENPNSPGTLYKSHMFVPITFRVHVDNNLLPKGIIKTLEIRDNGRSILGFIGVDHNHTYYFDDAPVSEYGNIDANVLYIYADLLSLIAITQRTFLQGSETVKEFREQQSQ